jgi:ferredoxin
MSTAVVVSPKKIHKVVVDRKACIGAATCVILAPKAFEMDDENIALVRESAHEVDDDTLLMAAQSCPTGAVQPATPPDWPLAYLTAITPTAKLTSTTANLSAATAGDVTAKLLYLDATNTKFNP